VAIVVLLLWLATAIIGITLLRAAGRARDEREAAAAPAAPVAAPVRIGAAPLTAAGLPPPIPHSRVGTPAGDHTLLEFSHPTLAISGIACWIMFTFVQYEPLAWIAFGFLTAALLMGLAWFAISRRSARQETTQTWSFPPRLVAVHGAIATLSIALTALTAVVASRG
jgi:hypothetical protein